MIEFITLFLGGLVAGPQTVEIMAGDAVAVVEVWLDGELEERLARPPWKLEVDFGHGLSPHVLEAVALDSSDKELARTLQWINMSPEQAQSSLMIEGDDRGQGAVARVLWESLGETEEPSSVEAYFDGESLTVEDPQAIQLPSFDPKKVHHLRVRLEFSEALFSEAEAVLGGAYGSEVSTEISAVPIWFEKGREPKETRAMQSWFTVGGEPQAVNAIEKGLAEIIVVRDVAAKPHLHKLAVEATRSDSDIRLRKDFRLSFIIPCPTAHQRDDYRQLLYPRSQRLSSKDGGLLRLLAWVAPMDCSAPDQQLADALAIAGLSASKDGSRRVVLLILSSGAPLDHSTFTPAQVVSYLEDLRVPLVIWSVGPYGEPDTKWGQAIRVRKLSRLDKAFGLLEKNLKRQLIVWLEGLHLPQWVELSPDAEDVALVK